MADMAQEFVWDGHSGKAVSLRLPPKLWESKAILSLVYNFMIFIMRAQSCSVPLTYLQKCVCGKIIRGGFYNVWFDFTLKALWMCLSPCVSIHVHVCSCACVCSGLNQDIHTELHPQSFVCLWFGDWVSLWWLVSQLLFQFSILLPQPPVY